MSVSFKGFNEKVLTFKTEQELAQGTLVRLVSNGTVGECAQGDVFIGVTVSCKGGIAAVQLSGFVTVPYSGTAPALGLACVSAADGTAVAADSSGRQVTVLELDTTAGTAGIVL